MKTIDTLNKLAIELYRNKYEELTDRQKRKVLRVINEYVYPKIKLKETC